MENFILGVSMGLFVWAFTYGFNRVWLMFKTLIS